MELDQKVLDLALQKDCRSFEDIKVVLVGVRLYKVRKAEWKDYLNIQNFHLAVNSFSNEVIFLRRYSINFYLQTFGIFTYFRSV